MPPKKDYISKEQYWNERKLYRVLKNDNVNITLILKVSKIKHYLHVDWIILVYEIFIIPIFLLLFSPYRSTKLPLLPNFMNVKSITYKCTKNSQQMSNWNIMLQNVKVNSCSTQQVCFFVENYAYIIPKHIHLLMYSLTTTVKCSRTFLLLFQI